MILDHLCAITSPQELVEKLQDLDINDEDWSNDVQQVTDAWNSFIDRVPTGARTFVEFKHHIARCQRGDPLDPGVRLLTVHKAQGNEFKSVAIVACNDGQFPDFRARGTEAVEAEQRTFYVAVSRPSRVLVISRSRSRRTRFGTRNTEPSPFLKFVVS